MYKQHSQSTGRSHTGVQTERTDVMKCLVASQPALPTALPILSDYFTHFNVMALLMCFYYITFYYITSYSLK